MSYLDLLGEWVLEPPAPGKPTQKGQPEEPPALREGVTDALDLLEPCRAGCDRGVHYRHRMSWPCVTCHGTGRHLEVGSVLQAVRRWAETRQPQWRKRFFELAATEGNKHDQESMAVAYCRAVAHVRREIGR